AMMDAPEVTPEQRPPQPSVPADKSLIGKGLEFPPRNPGRTKYIRKFVLSCCPALLEGDHRHCHGDGGTRAIQFSTYRLLWICVAAIAPWPKATAIWFSGRATSPIA